MKKLFKGDSSGGFTLVELLIVIALLGVIALIVIAAINPIEQANRATDTRMKSDGAQLISAVDRYFASISEFPWVTENLAASNAAAYGFVSADDIGIGICGDANCVADGALIETDELKTEFKNRDFIGETLVDKRLMLGKAQGTSESIYACFIPSAKATQDKAISGDNVYTIDASGVRTAQPDLCDADDADWVTSECYICVPE